MFQKEYQLQAFLIHLKETKASYQTYQAYLFHPPLLNHWLKFSVQFVLMG